METFIVIEIDLATEQIMLRAGGKTVRLTAADVDRLIADLGEAQDATDGESSAS